MPIVFGVLGVAFTIALFVILPTTVFIGGMLGVLLAIFFVAQATASIWLPALAKLLENDPKDPNKFAATTKVLPRQLKFVMKGGMVTRGLMNYAGYKQKGGTTAPPKFEIVPLANGEAPPQEEMGVIDAWIFRHSGYRFFNPFNERIYAYELPRTKEVMGRDGQFTIEGVSDISDYFLLSEQSYSFSIVNADTGQGENVKVTLHGKVTFQIVNPFLSAFTDKSWHQQIIAAMLVRGRNFVRARDYETLLGEVEKEGAELKDLIGRDLAKVSDEIEGGLGAEKLFGVRVNRVQIETLEMTDAEAEKKRVAKYNAARDAEVVAIAAEAEGKRRKKIRAADAEAEATYIKTVAEATRAESALGLKLMDQQTQIAMAKGAGTTILNVGGIPTAINPLDVAILEELKKGNVGSSDAGNQQKHKKGA